MLTKQTLIDNARLFNRYVPPPAYRWDRPSGPSDDGRTRPGDVFNQRATWADVLEPAGWQYIGRCGERLSWKRPGKEEAGLSATTGHCVSDAGNDLLYVFSTNAAPFEDKKSYSKFAAYCVLNHDGDFHAASHALAARGYGEVSLPAGRLLLHHEPPNGSAGNGAEPKKDPVDRFGRPIPFLDLKRDSEALWLWNGYLSRGGITLLTALWKAGKTTILAHLLHQLESGGTFCGRDLSAGKALYVSEESQGRWAERRDAIGIGNHCRLLSRPFKVKPSTLEWMEFLDYLKGLQADWPADLIVFDTISNLWPVRDENDAAGVQAALMPLHKITEQVSLLLVHHNRKGDGQEATAARGSGALSAFVDTIVELRRYQAGERQDKRRTLTGYGRYDETPPELVVELTDEGFKAQGTAADVSCRDLSAVIMDILPIGPPGLTQKQMEESWPEKAKPANKRLLDALHHGTECGIWICEGEGKRGDPYRFFKRPF